MDLFQDNHPVGEMSYRRPYMPLRTIARIAGFLYLIYIVSLVFTSIIHPHIFARDAAVTINNMSVYEGRFRIAFMTELLSTVFFLLAAWALYVLLRQVDKNVALLFVLLNLGGVAVQCTSTLSQYAPILLLRDAYYARVFQAAELQALAMFFSNLGTNGFMIANVFYGVWLFPLGYLVLKCGFLPRILGIMLIIDCFAVLIWVLQFFFFSDFAAVTYLLYPTMFIAEFSFSLWLLIKGVDEKQLARWQLEAGKDWPNQAPSKPAVVLSEEEKTIS